MDDFDERQQSPSPEAAPRAFAAPSAEVGARQHVWRRRRRVALAAASVAVVVGIASVGAHKFGGDNDARPGTSTESATGTGAGASAHADARSFTRPDPVYVHSDQPPPVVLRLSDRDVALRPWTFCWQGPEGEYGISSSICADGTPAKVADLDDAGRPNHIPFWFGIDDWEFEATFRQLGVTCPHAFTVDATATSDRSFRLDTAGPAGRYQVDLSGRGEGGDVYASFVWTTPTDGPIDQPTASIAVVTHDEDRPRDLVTYGGLDLIIDDLNTTPERATARVLVTAANGRSLALDARRSSRPDCAEAGSLSFSGSASQAQAVTTLGPTPFTYQVGLNLDGQQYVGTAVWPRDEPKDGSAFIPMRFHPPLPAYITAD